MAQVVDMIVIYARTSLYPAIQLTQLPHYREHQSRKARPPGYLTFKPYLVAASGLTILQQLCIVYGYTDLVLQGCPTVTLSHQDATGDSKRATNQKLMAIFNWKIFAKHDRLSQSNISLLLFLMQIVLKKQ